MTTFYIIIGCAVLALIVGYLAGGADWFRDLMGDSETLFFARLNILLGLVGTVAEQFIAYVPAGEIPWWAMAVVGASLEWLRRRRAEDV